MTSDVEQVEVECPACGTQWTDWTRASVNLALDPWADEDYLRECATVVCPTCGLRSDIGAVLVVDPTSPLWPL